MVYFKTFERYFNRINFYLFSYNRMKSLYFILICVMLISVACAYGPLHIIEAHGGGGGGGHGGGMGGRGGMGGHGGRGGFGRGWGRGFGYYRGPSYYGNGGYDDYYEIPLYYPPPDNYYYYPYYETL
jgi:hypothetical protein